MSANAHIHVHIHHIYGKETFERQKYREILIFRISETKDLRETKLKAHIINKEILRHFFAHCNIYPDETLICVILIYPKDCTDPSSYSQGL